MDTQSGGTSRSNRYVGTIWAIVAVAFAVRLANVFVTSAIPFRTHPVGDAAGYLRWADRIVHSDFLSEDGFYQAPLYPYVLAMVSLLFGASLTPILIVQATLGAIAVLLLAFTAGRLFGSAAGVCAAVMAALYPPAIYFDGIIQKASLGFLLATATLYFAVRLRESKAFGDAVGSGVFLGLLCITRENAIAWIPVLLFWSFVVVGPAGISRRLLASGQFVLGLVTILLPTALANYSQTGQLAVSTFQAGTNFYIGNHAGATGRYAGLVRGHETPEFERTDATRLAEIAMGQTLTPREVSRHWFRRALADIRAEPSAWLRLLAAKWMMLWNWYEVSDVESQYIYADYSPIIRVLGYVWHFGILATIAAVGIALTIHQWRSLWHLYLLLGVMALSVAMFYIMARYRYPLVPIMILFGAGGAVRLFEALRRSEWRRLLLALAVAMAAAVCSHWPVHDTTRLNAAARMNLGTSLASAGDLAAACAQFRRAVSSHPSSAEAQYNLAQALAMRGRHLESLAHYAAAVDSDADLPGLHYNYAVALEQAGDRAAALYQYRLALKADPHDADARAAVQRLTVEEIR